jgi:hypothetical protein
MLRRFVDDDDDDDADEGFERVVAVAADDQEHFVRDRPSTRKEIHDAGNGTSCCCCYWFLMTTMMMMMIIRGPSIVFTKYDHCENHRVKNKRGAWKGIQFSAM